MRGGEFAQLRAFMEVAKHRSFARAAAELGVSRSALSQTLQNLERRLGARLLNRTTRSVAPTGIGGDLLERLVPLIRELDEIVTLASDCASRVSGALRINAPKMAAIHALSPLVAPFLEAYPDVTLDIITDDKLVDIVGEGFDAGVRLGESLDQDMIATRLGPELRMMVTASPSYIDRHGAPASPRDLRSHRCINLRWPTDRSIYRWEFERGADKFNILLDGPLLVDEAAVALQAMLDGVGIAYLFEHHVGQAVADGRAVHMLKDWSPPFPGFYLYYPSRQASPPLRAFVDFIQRQRTSAKRLLCP